VSRIIKQSQESHTKVVKEAASWVIRAKVASWDFELHTKAVNEMVKPICLYCKYVLVLYTYK
jgi:hypothetical protein